MTTLCYQLSVVPCPLLEITIEGADFFLEQTQDEHNTGEFESSRHLVVRRGAEIKFEVSLILNSNKCSLRHHSELAHVDFS